jgi:FlaG/FlaF family flagellin (archaellin)
MKRVPRNRGVAAAIAAVIAVDVAVILAGVRAETAVATSGTPNYLHGDAAGPARSF